MPGDGCSPRASRTKASLRSPAKATEVSWPRWQWPATTGSFPRQSSTTRSWICPTRCRTTRSAGGCSWARSSVTSAILMIPVISRRCRNSRRSTMWRNCADRSCSRPEWKIRSSVANRRKPSRRRCARRVSMSLRYTSIGRAMAMPAGKPNWCAPAKSSYFSAASLAARQKNRSAGLVVKALDSGAFRQWSAKYSR